MSTHIVWDLETLRRGTEGWEDQERLMDSAARDLRGASTAALPPSVQGAAKGFLDSWAGSAEESSAIARGFVGALQATGDDYSTTDDGADRRFSDLDGRLGPAR